jgi:hypothetical protein
VWLRLRKMNDSGSPKRGSDDAVFPAHLGECGRQARPTRPISMESNALSRMMPRLFMATDFLAVLCLAARLLQPPATQAQKPIVPAPTGREGNDQGELTDPTKVVEKLKVRQLKAQLDELRIQSKTLANHLIFAPEVEVQKEDYAQARLRFRTKLLRKGPSPQPWSPIKSPAGVTEIKYASGALRLKAWVNRPADQSRKRPAVLFLHGGFALSMGDWEQTTPYRDAGFVVMVPMLRRENGQRGAFSYFYDEVDDVLAAAEYLSTQPYVDSNHLFLFRWRSLLAPLH